MANAFTNRTAFAAAILWALCAIAHGQISGTVTWNGKPVKDARVTAQALGKRVRSDAAGAWNFNGTAIGSRASLRSGESGRTAGNPAAFRDPATGALRRGDGRSLGAGAASDPARSLAKSAGAYIELKITVRGYLMKTVTVTDGQQGIGIALERDYRRHLWVWETNALTKPATRDSLFAFGALKGVGTYYMNAGGVLGSKDALLADFLDSAEARGCAVELLFGAPEWALTANHGEATALAKQTKALAASQDARLRAVPTSIQYDVEPYSLDAYTADPNGVGSQWVDMYVKIQADLAGTGVGVTACVPRWLETRPVARGGKTRTLDKWLADHSDRMTLMDYVDKAQGIQDGAAGELAYADSIGKEVVVGVETLAGLDPPSVTFAEEGEAAMDAALGIADPQFRKHPSYFGPAIHHWRAWQALKP